MSKAEEILDLIVREEWRGKKEKEARTLLFTVEVKASTLSFNPIY